MLYEFHIACFFRNIPSMWMESLLLALPNHPEATATDPKSGDLLRMCGCEDDCYSLREEPLVTGVGVQIDA